MVQRTGVKRLARYWRADVWEELICLTIAYSLSPARRAPYTEDVLK